MTFHYSLSTDTVSSGIVKNLNIKFFIVTFFHFPVQNISVKNSIVQCNITCPKVTEQGDMSTATPSLFQEVGKQWKTIH